MNSFFQLGLDTTPPQNIQMLSTDNVNFPYSDSAEITISADEPLGVFNSEIYIIDSKGNRFDVQMSPVSGKLHTIQNVMRLAQGVATIHAVVADNVGNQATDEVVQSMTIQKGLALHFYPAGYRKNPIVIKENMYHRSTAKLVPNSQNIVNKLWVKGGKALSELYTQDITVGTIPIPLFYAPFSPVTVTIGGIERTLGIQNIDAVGTKDFLLNANEKLLIPDLVTTGTGTISYLYQYPIKILLEEPVSQGQYGIFEDKLDVQTDDKELAIELGLKHLFKYSQPVISGRLSPFVGVFKAGETIKAEIPRLKIDSELLIKSVTLDSTPMKPIVITLNLETPERDLSNILKDLKQRLDKLEKDSYKDDEGPILKYIAKEELYRWTEISARTDPIQSEEWEFWAEEITRTEPIQINELGLWTEGAISTVYACPLPSETLYPSDSLLPC